ncbi:VOC family protein [Smaragdicoccus niigatensis]|uniref:VOC family protein n=1 Tax=Smaragdicoccus niigatensis TaxID=359359 RepID=UPI000366A8E9|nr:VOC family protein [Smaragdicoccus niigatensis]
MASMLNPYISFPGNAREALTFYHSVFGGDLEIHPFSEYGSPDAPEADNVMHGTLASSGGFTLMAADNPPGMPHVPGNNISISLSGDDEAELRGYWDKLTADGTIAVALEKQMWGDIFGMATDSFGITWLVNIAGS